MPNLLISCDEKWPIYDLEVPEEGQIANCVLTEDFYKEYLFIMTNYAKIQRILKVYYEEYEQRCASRSNGEYVEESRDVNYKQSNSA